MKKSALYLALILAVGGGGPFGWQAARALAAPDERRTYRTLEPDVYYPTFFKRFELDRAHGAAWVRVPSDVALTYVGRTRVCPSQHVSSTSPADGRTVFTITRLCPYSRMVVKQYRIELMERDGAWEIEWAGMRLKCAVNQNPVGAFLVNHNPFAARFAWTMPLNSAVRSLANAMNPWVTECP